MAIFEKIGGAIAGGVSSSASKAKDIADNQKLNGELSAKKKELEYKFSEIGRAYVYRYEDEKIIDVINALREQALAVSREIEELEVKIAAAKGLKKCEHCAQLIDNASTFCAFCGQKQTVVVNKCVKCRAVIDENAAFCFNCGAKQPSKNPSAAPNVEEALAVIEDALGVAAEPSAPSAAEEALIIEDIPAVAPVIEEKPAAEEIEAVIEDIPAVAPVIEEKPAVEDIVPDFVPAPPPVIEKSEEEPPVVIEPVVTKPVEDAAEIKKNDGATCPGCGSEVEAGSAFCTECGYSLKTAASAEVKYVFCTECGNKEESGTRFCSECGTKLEY